MKGRIGKVVAATTAASLACEVPLPAVVDEVFVANPRDLGTDALVEALEAATGREISIDPRELPQVVVNEAYLPETHDPESPQAPRRPERELPRSYGIT